MITPGIRAFYNDTEQFACAWLSNLMDDGLITPGVISDKSIVDLTPDDIRGFERVHLFAGIAGWDHALNLAGWGARPVGTGSCPCQPYSVAGKRKGNNDARNLWPEMRRIIAFSGIPTWFGEQVKGAIGFGWLDGIFADLEGTGHTCAAAVLGAHSGGAPHIRQRLFWLADSQRDTGDTRRLADESSESDGAASAGARNEPGRHGDAGRLLHSAGARQFSEGQWAESETRDQTRLCGPEPGCSASSGLGDDNDARSQGRREHTGEHADQFAAWAASVFIPCLDGKYRRVPANEAGEPEPSLFPLAHGVPNRVGTLRGAGNAIVPQIAAEFVKAFLEVKNFAS